MARAIRVHPAALDDLAGGRDFYEGQEEGLGDYFLDSLKSDIDSLQISAGMHAVFFGTHHRLLSKRFPWAVYYRLVGDVVWVDAVLDCRQSPAATRRRFR